MARIPDEQIERIKREVPLADLCREYGIELRGSGKNLMAKSPFREEEEASFVVTPGKNLWNDLGADGEGGDNIQLVMRMEKISFRRAAEKLLARLGAAPEAGKVTTRVGTAHEILADPDDGLNDIELKRHVVGFYHTTFCNQPQAMQYLQKRKCFHPEAVKHFRIGYANRTLGYRVPSTTTAGKQLKKRLQKTGILRESGHEHLNGSVVVPLFDRHGTPVQIYGRKITAGLRKGTPDHLYLPAPKRGLFNGEALQHQREWIVCESILDALTLWVHGFRNVTCTFGAGDFNEDLWSLVHDVRPGRIVCCQDNDKAGNAAVAKLAPRLGELGIGVWRGKLPPECDVNRLACESKDARKALAVMLEEAECVVAVARSGTEEAAKKENAPALEPAPMLDPEPTPDIKPPSSLAACPEPAEAAAPQAPVAVPPPKAEPGAASCCPEARGDDLFFRFGEREYRVRGLAKNTSYEALKINLRVRVDEDRFHQDNLDLFAAKAREHFVRAASAETALKDDILKRDLGKLLLKLEEMQEADIRRMLEPKRSQVPGMKPEEQEEALALLRDPKLMERIVEAFDACGVVGEDTNKLVGYLAALSRKFEKPLGVIIQSTSAAGKTTLMEAVLAFVPEEERVKYSAMTGQALFYLGETDIAHKILAIAEEEGAERATYALKLLQSEGELTIASTGKDATTGRLVTEEYHVQGPAMIFFTTTSIEVDEELGNRCLTLTVDESREQTRRIHELQRAAETIDGHLDAEVRARVLRTHRNAQRLLRALPVHNPFASRLTFPDESTRMRRDQQKYLTLIRAIALLHQHQRPIRKRNGTDYIEVTLDDIAAANRLAGEVLGRSLDEMPPQTRRFLELLWQMVSGISKEREIEPQHLRFGQREVRKVTGWTPMQVKRHMGKLVELEYLIVHHGGRGQSWRYELVYQGEGGDGRRFLPGLIDVANLQFDEKWGGRNGDLGGPGAPQGHARGTAGAPAQDGSQPSNQAGCGPINVHESEKARRGKEIAHA